MKMKKKSRRPPKVMKKKKKTDIQDRNGNYIKIEKPIKLSQHSCEKSLSEIKAEVSFKLQKEEKKEVHKKGSSSISCGKLSCKQFHESFATLCEGSHCVITRTSKSLVQTLLSPATTSSLKTYLDSTLFCKLSSCMQDIQACSSSELNWFLEQLIQPSYCKKIIFSFNSRSVTCTLAKQLDCIFKTLDEVQHAYTCTSSVDLKQDINSFLQLIRCDKRREPISHTALQTLCLSKVDQPISHTALQTLVLSKVDQPISHTALQALVVSKVDKLIINIEKYIKIGFHSIFDKMIQFENIAIEKKILSSHALIDQLRSITVINDQQHTKSSHPQIVYSNELLEHLKKLQQLQLSCCFQNSISSFFSVCVNEAFERYLIKLKSNLGYPKDAIRVSVDDCSDTLCIQQQPLFGTNPHECEIESFYRKLSNQKKKKSKSLEQRKVFLFKSFEENLITFKESVSAIIHFPLDSDMDNDLPTTVKDKSYKRKKTTLARYTEDESEKSYCDMAELILRDPLPAICNNNTKSSSNVVPTSTVIKLRPHRINYGSSLEACQQIGLPGCTKTYDSPIKLVYIKIIGLPKCTKTYDSPLKLVYIKTTDIAVFQRLLSAKHSVKYCNIILDFSGSNVCVRNPRNRKSVILITETSSDYSKSQMVSCDCSQRTLCLVKKLKTTTTELAGIPSHEKLNNANIGSLKNLSASSNQTIPLLKGGGNTTTVPRTVPVAANTKPTAESPIRLKGPSKSNSKQPQLSRSQTQRVQADSARQTVKPPTNIKLQVVTPNETQTPHQSQQVSTRHVNHTSNSESAASVQTSVQLGRSQEWISTTTKLLHVPDYPKMIMFLNEVTPVSDDIVAHRFIRGIAFFKVGKFRQAMGDLHEAETIAVEMYELKTSSDGSVLDSGVYSMRSLDSQPGARFPSVQIRGKRGDIALCNVYMGDLHYSSSSYREASKCYQRAAEYYEHDCVARLFRMIPPSLSTIHSKCGSCLRNLSKSMEAIQEYRNAIEAAVRDKDRLTAYTSLGNLLQSLGQNKEALVEYKCALELAEELNDHLSIGWTNGNIGNCYLGMLEKDKALYHLQKALDITIEHEPKPESIGRAYNNIGTAYQSMGDLDKAEEFYDLALSQSIYGNDLAGQARVYGNIGNIFIVRKNFEKAIPHYTEVLRLSKDSATISTAQHNRGCAYYEWAETKMLTLEKSLSKHSSSTPDNPVFRFHGSKSILPSELSPRIVIDSIGQLFKDGMTDLQKVVESHETKLDHIKGSSKGLSLSVSLTESNSRTFHRLQECMVALGNWRDALLVADQSRSRTLGEIMLSKKQNQLETPLTSPVSMEHVYKIVSSQNSPVLYLSHTGFRLLGWVLVPLEDSKGVNMEMFEVPLTDDQFDGKSFDYHIRYGLTEVLVEKSYEMYRSMDYDEENTVHVSQLYKLIGKPLKMILERLTTGNKATGMQKIVLVTDTYTSLLPFTCMYDSESGTFLGDQFYFESMLSFLTMGIMSQLPEPIVELPGDQHNMCIVGNPVIPKFYHNNEVWSLGTLPYAKREAQWVGHILNTPPILDEQATKNAIMMRFMRAKIIHIATHGSSISGFLAFAALTATRSGEVVDSSGVLLHPEEVEQLSISPALVVLSSCDSSRGTVKADGVQGMARAFLLAGAQAVLTALWKVPDESAAVFMRFFYRFLALGFESSLALQKSILSLRCFSKYSQYIHWSGYQLTGRSIRLDVKPSPVTAVLEYTLRPSTPFPRLMLLKKLEGVLVDNPRLPTDIQILHGSPGVKPSEVAIDFIHSCHSKFAAGIFWVCCRTPETIDASLNYIEKVVKKPLIELRMCLNDTQQSLLVLDNATELPNSERLTLFMKHSNVHVIILSKSTDSLDSLVKEVDKSLLRGCAVHEVKTLSTIDSTQRIVYEVLQQHYLKASNKDQATFEKLAEFTSGSPLIVDIATQVLLKFIREHSDEPSDALQKFGESIHLSKSRKKCLEISSNVHARYQVRAISDQLTRLVPEITTVSPHHKDVWESESEYDSWDSIAELLKLSVSSSGEMLLLRALAIFGCIPIPLPLVTAMSSLVAKATGHSHLSGIFHERLMEAKLVLKYPHPVVLHSSFNETNTANKEPLFLYLPQHLSSQLWICDDVDQLMAISIAHKALQKCIEKDSDMKFFYLGLFAPLEEKSSSLLEDGKECYGAVYQLYLQLSHQLCN